jgi:flagellar biosynthesis protein FlhB
MADTDLEKTEAPTPKRLQDAANDGKVARSQELMIAASLLGGSLVLAKMGPETGERLAALFSHTLTVAGTMELTTSTAAQLLRETGWNAFVSVIGLLAALSAAPILIATAQAKGTFTMKPITPQFSRISPLTNAKNLFGMRQVTELVKSLAKVGIVAGAVYVAIDTAIPDTIALAQQSPAAIGTVTLTYAVKLLSTAGLAYLALAGSDYLWQWWQLQKQLRMTKDEVRQEHKQSEGDPHVKSRRRSIARSYARRQMMADVPKADVVIVNPTHIAIAIKYDPSIAPAPIVLAIGQNKVAERIKAIAAASGVPMVENRPIARALLKTARVGTIIPVDLYVAVAEILAFILRTRGTRGAWTGSATA